jgi:hypothetical protein
LKFQTNWLGSELLRVSVHDSQPNHSADGRNPNEETADRAKREQQGRRGTVRKKPKAKSRNKAKPEFGRAKPPALY